MNIERIRRSVLPVSSTRLKKVASELGGMVLLVTALLAARSTLADHYHVPSGSMEPTLMVGDRVVVNKLAYGLRVPFTQWHLTDGDSVQRGEVVIFDSPQDGKRLIKRIVAVGGDKVAIHDGHLMVNGRSLALLGEQGVEAIGERIVHLNLKHGGGPDLVQEVPAGKLLAVGDHRGNSLDGRIFGLVDETAVYGRAIAVYYRSDNGFVWKTL